MAPERTICSEVPCAEAFSRACAQQALDQSPLSPHTNLSCGQSRSGGFTTSNRTRRSRFLGRVAVAYVQGSPKGGGALCVRRVVNTRLRPVPPCRLEGFVHCKILKALGAVIAALLICSSAQGRPRSSSSQPQNQRTAAAAQAAKPHFSEVAKQICSGDLDIANGIGPAFIDWGNSSGSKLAKAFAGDPTTVGATKEPWKVVRGEVVSEAPDEVVCLFDLSTVYVGPVGSKVFKATGLRFRYSSPNGRPKWDFLSYPTEMANIPARLADPFYRDMMSRFSIDGVTIGVSQAKLEARDRTAMAQLEAEAAAKEERERPRRSACEKAGGTWGRRGGSLHAGDPNSCWFQTTGN